MTSHRAWGLAALVSGGCLPALPTSEAPVHFSDTFERADLGPRYRMRGGSWRVEDGALRTLGDHNQPLWLDVPLARNARVEFTATSRSPSVDMKVELYGDGMRHESGYVVILGGWKNTITAIARRDEHQRGRAEIRRSWEANRQYRWKLQRIDGKTLELFIDGERVLAYEDFAPLHGPGNDRLAFTSWESDVTYDDLVITPLP